MDESAKANTTTGDQSLVLAKILLRKFDILHDFHVHQLQRYLIACSLSSLGGELSINAGLHTVYFDIKLDFFFKRVKGKIVPRHPLSVPHMINRFKKKEYDKQTALAVDCLSSWTKELLWGPETQVKVRIDGREY